MQCRFCKSELTDVFIDLNNSPASNSFLTADELNEPEAYYPLKVFTCRSCLLVQIAEYKKCESIFDDKYVYFSSYSTSWLRHVKDYTDSMVSRFGFNESSLVVEIASNDGYLLQYFKQKNIPVLGIEPTANTADVAVSKGIETVVRFFNVPLANELAENGKKADLLIGNNVLAHVPDVVDFIAGLKILLKGGGVITMEFPHLMQLVENNQFDTIYHEHFSYFSFITVKKIFESQGLAIFDVEEIPTHGGSLRIYAKHGADKSKQISPNVAALLYKEISKGMDNLAYYDDFQLKAFDIKLNVNRFLLYQKANGKKIAGYGAAAKGNTLLNFLGIKNDIIDFVIDANPNKQNKFLPGSHIPVVDEAILKQEQPDYLLIFPWNIKDEVMQQLSYVKAWGCKFVTTMPAMCVIEEELISPAA